MKVSVDKLCLTLCDPMGNNPPGSSVYGILQARILEWVAISFSRDLPHPRLKWSEVAQSYPTLCNPMDCSLPCSSIHGIFQARVLEWVAISFSKGSSRPRDRTWVSCVVGRRFTVWATREVRIIWWKWYCPIMGQAFKRTGCFCFLSLGSQPQCKKSDYSETSMMLASPS